MAKFKSGDKVKYKDGDARVFTVHTVYSPAKVSLGLYDYPDTEQDYTTKTTDLIKVGKI